MAFASFVKHFFDGEKPPPHTLQKGRTICNKNRKYLSKATSRIHLPLAKFLLLLAHTDISWYNVVHIRSTSTSLQPLHLEDLVTGSPFVTCPPHFLQTWYCNKIMLIDYLTKVCHMIRFVLCNLHCPAVKSMDLPVY